jgi:hypothetical protein
MLRALTVASVIGLALIGTLSSTAASSSPLSARSDVHLPATPLAAVRLMACPASSPIDTKNCPKHPSGWVQPCYRGGKNDTPTWSRKNGCPITNKLRRRLLQNPTSGTGGGFDPICRCQEDPQKLTLAVARMKSGRAWVDEVLEYGTAANHYRERHHITFVVVKQMHVWLVNNTYCTGKPKTTIYHSPVAGC